MSHSPGAPTPHPYPPARDPRVAPGAQQPAGQPAVQRGQREADAPHVHGQPAAQDREADGQQEQGERAAQEAQDQQPIARPAGTGGVHKVPGAPFTGDARDTYIAPEEVNATTRYVLYSVFRTAGPLPADATARATLASDAAVAVEAAGGTVRGWYDVGGFRADADLLLWQTGDDPEALQAGYQALRRSALGRLLEPVWSNMGVHRPAEFNSAHTPGCFSGIAPRPWLTVYPFVRSYEWYYLEASKRSHMLRTHGMAAATYPDVIGSTTAAFALGDYEWLLAFEADQLHRLTDAMRAQRGVEARLHVREETPFFTGPRVDLATWVERQPTA